MSLPTLIEMEIETYTFLERIMCDCEALCECGWHERWFGSED